MLKLEYETPGDAKVDDEAPTASALATHIANAIRLVVAFVFAAFVVGLIVVILTVGR